MGSSEVASRQRQRHVANSEQVFAASSVYGFRKDEFWAMVGIGE